MTKQAFATVSALVETVPTFIGRKQLSAILHAVIVHRAHDEQLSSALASTAARKIPTKTMFPVVMDMWKLVQSEGETVSPDIEKLKLALALKR